MQNNILKTKSKSVKLGVAGAAFAAALLAPSVAKADSYTVQSGDTLSKIASAHNTTVDYLASVKQLNWTQQQRLHKQLAKHLLLKHLHLQQLQQLQATHHHLAHQMQQRKKQSHNVNQAVATQHKTDNTMVVTN